ncbi:MAG: FtsX-like permease family protein [Candidatus Hydrogenedentes bacterium]|nr:FtsX-like permease family protein [Candidatus Hydrogenedentota bacterium]
MIQDQVRLPLSVAIGVVMQGIRIRFGRSLITLMGVALGTAFLVSNLTGQAINAAVRQEEQSRSEVKRMASFLEAEMGPPRDRIVGVIQTGPLDENEQGLIRFLIDSRVKSIQWYNAAPETPISQSEEAECRRDVSLEGVANQAGSVLLMGSGPLPDVLTAPEPVASLFKDAAGKILACTRTPQGLASPPGVAVVELAREFTPEELIKIAEQKTQAQFRRNWITLISMVVTVAGIANAMLMSVTERFREIGTMKCLGALSSFVRWIFFFESSFMGAVGGVMGGVAGTVFSLAVYGFTYGYGLVFSSVDWVLLGVYLVLSVLVGIGLSIVAAIYPAGVAASMVPANALRTDV